MHAVISPSSLPSSFFLLPLNPSYPHNTDSPSKVDAATPPPVSAPPSTPTSSALPVSSVPPPPPVSSPAYACIYPSFLPPLVHPAGVDTACFDAACLELQLRRRSGWVAEPDTKPEPGP
ncbi:hypothetical protein MVEN_00145300 [Mycena venus]|uniref:Uncharacterized protein n=1 Tax=Mycena venus TaxID=2733690 RepID=A0A8H6YZV7_9AGAR|nr:hypothetical protein MVEN_00145300 [Mycena venus]